MPSAARSAVAPLYLFACLVLGGSAQGIWQNAALQLIGLAIIAWAACGQGGERPSRSARQLLLITISAVGVIGLQSLPLPPSVWAHGVRDPLAAGYRLLGVSAPWLPVSLTPYGTSATLLYLMPPVAIFVAMVRLNAYRPSWMAAALLAAVAAGITLGALQVMNGGTASHWYLYEQTNIGRAVGFFANASHMAMLLVVASPFVIAIAAAGRRRNLQHYSALVALLTAAGLLLVVGVALNGSLAGFLLIAPVMGVSSLILMKRPSALRPVIAAAAVIAVLVAVGTLAATSIGGQKVGENAHTSVQSRSEIARTTATAIADFMPWGSGLGSFAKVYHLYEKPESVTNEYVVHAHNDYLELLLELGIAGGALILIFLAWWARAVGRVWKRPEASPYALAATIASAALLLHSLVEFPLRTAAMSACFAMCLGLLADRRQPPPREAGDLRPTRHIVIR